MVTDNRTEVSDSAEKDIRQLDPDVAITKMENELKAMAESLRKIRHDFVSGMISEKEMQQIDAKFAEMLVKQRSVLQLLRSASRK